MKRIASVLMMFSVLTVATAFADDTNQEADVQGWAEAGEAIGSAVAGSAAGFAGAVIGGVLAPTSTAPASIDEAPPAGTPYYSPDGN